MDKINGPWKVYTESPVDGRMETLSGGQHYHSDYVAVVDAKGDVVCDNGEYYPTSIDPDHAHLIAAAPDLLKALEDALDSLEYVQRTYGGSVAGWGVRSDRMEECKAAIAKATVWSATK